MAREITSLLAGFSFTEAPRWHQGRLWFSDLYLQKVFSSREDGSDLATEVDMPGQPMGIDWLPDGRLIIVSGLDRKLLVRAADGTLSVHGDLSRIVPWTLNDLVIDRNGNAYVGSFGFDLFSDDPLTPTALHCVDIDGHVAEVADNLWFPNGSVITDDNVLIVNESFSNRISAFNVIEGGALGNRRTWASFAPVPTESDLAKATGQMVIGPDGLALDADGAVWVADCLNERILRVLEGGEVTEEIHPGTGVYGCALGGVDGRTLFLCVAPDFIRDRRRGLREASVLSVRVDVPAAQHS